MSPGGQPTTDLLKVVRPELQIDLRAALFRAFEEGKSSFTPPVPVQFNGAPHLVYLFVRPRPQAGGAVRALVLFLEDERPVTPAPLPSSATTETVHQLASELRHTQERLQGAREAYETTVEELRAANEELQSTNEEYKSTLEELETSKEELQSINEELQTINQELKSKVDEVTQAHDDLQNLFGATNIATLFLDRQLQVKRYTPRAADLFNLMPPDRGRPIAHLRANLHYPQLEADAQQVLQSLVPTEREVTSQAGRWYLGQVRPYRTMDDRIDGVAISFVDITAIKQTAEALRNSEARFRSALGAMLDAALLLTPIYDATQAISDFRIDFASRVALDVAQLRHDEFVGRSLTAVFPNVATTGLLATYRQVFQNQSAMTDLFYYEDTVGAYANGRWIEAHISPMQEGIIAVWHDVTAWKEAEAGLQRLNETLEERVVERTTQVRTLASTLTLAEQEERRRISQILHDDLQQRLYGIQMRVLSIINDVAANNQTRLPRYAQEVYDWIGDAIQTTRQLTVDLSPPVLKNEGLVDALAWLATQMAAVNGLQVTIQASDPCIVPQEDMRVLLFQSVRELLFNVVKHAATDHATVELAETTTGELRIVVRDEGRGFDITAVAGKQSGGFGLFSVRERLNLFGGQMAIKSAPGQGTEITIYAPIAP